MGLEPIYQRPRTTVSHPGHQIYPYLLRDMVIGRPNQVWFVDITYIPMRRGFQYLIAIMDWATRKVLFWRLSNTMDSEFCIEALEEALVKFGRTGDLQHRPRWPVHRPHSLETTRAQDLDSNETESPPLPYPDFSMASYGYARVSSLDQNLGIQRAALKAAGCDVIRAEKASGARRDGRTELQVLLDFLRRELSSQVRFDRAEGRCQRCRRPHLTLIRCLPDGRWFDEQATTWRDRRGRTARWSDLVEATQFQMTRVVLAAAHLDSDPTNSRLTDLRALCQRCHLLHDRSHHLAQRWITYRRRQALGDLFLGPYQALVAALSSQHPAGMLGGA
jgi:integrase-like protein/resolvase-like protein